MAIDNFRVVCVLALPTEAEPVLVVDPNAVLSCPVAFEGLQAVARRQLQVAQLPRTVQLRELAERHPLELRRQAVIPAALPQSLGLPAGKARNHRLPEYRGTI